MGHDESDIFFVVVIVNASLVFATIGRTFEAGRAQGDGAHVGFETGVCS